MIKDLTIAEIDELLVASNFLFAQKPFPLKILSENLQEVLAKTEWVNGSDLISDLKKITDSKNLTETQKKLTERKTELEAKPVESTVPQKEQLEKLEEEAEKRKAEAKESAEKAQKKQEQWLKLQKEKVLEELKGKIVYAVPEKPEPEIKLSEHEQAQVNNANRNARVFEQKLAEDIIKKNPEIFQTEELKPLADVIAADTTKVFIDPAQKPIPTGVFAALTTYKDSPEIQKTGVIYTLLSEEKQNLYREILNRTVGINLANKVLGFPETVYEFSQTPPEKPEGSFSINLDGLQRNSFTLQESPLFQTFDNPFLGEAKTAASGQLKDFAFSKIASLPKEGFLGSISRFVTSRSFDSVAPLLGLPTQMTYTGATFFGKMITTFVPQYAPLITNFTAKLGIDIGIKALAPVAATAIEAGITTAGGVAVKTGLAATLSTALSALGSWAPVVGNIIGAVIGWVVGKALEPILNWIKKHQEDLKILGLIMLGGGMIMRSLPLMITGGLIFAPIALRTGFSMAGIAARTTFLFGRIGASMAITIGTPIIVAIIVFPILVAIILFIINSSAYIVPPAFWGGGGGTAAPCPDGGIEITADLAGKITGGAVQLLPDSNGARKSHFCITPTMIILHSSGGYDNATGADMTFGTLVQRNLACQLATDTVKTLLMQPFYETQVEMAWCANSWDSFGVSIEISGECLGSSCNPANSSCGPYDNPVFNNPPPHPCDPETDNAASAVCAVMNQYKIPWCQIYTHDDVPDAIHADPTGKDWVYNYFIPKIKNICPNDQGGLCN